MNISVDRKSSELLRQVIENSLISALNSLEIIIIQNPNEISIMEIRIQRKAMGEKR